MMNSKNFFMAVLLGASHAVAALAAQSGIALPSQPDYESEKLQFQRGSVMYYGLPQADERARGADMAALRAAAEKDDAQAQVTLGVLSEQGRGVPQDYRTAQAWYEKAAPHSADARFLLGLMHYQGKGVPVDFAQARQWWESAASEGSVAAQVDLGWMCEYGQGLKSDMPDFACALHRYEQAAADGDAIGMFDAGTLYYLGKGVAQDYAQARRWFRKAAEKNFAGAQYNLGVMALGQGQDRNPMEAYQWFRLVQIAFYPGGGYNIGKVADELSAQQKRQAEAWVSQWLASHH
jgi:hypothetical protein